MDPAIRQKARELAAKTAQLYRQLSARRKETVLSAELLRSGAGVGASLARAGCAMSKTDQVLRVYAALQGCAEAKYWLEVLNDNQYLTEFEFSDTLKTCDEMGRLLSDLVRTLRAGLKPQAT